MRARKKLNLFNRIKTYLKLKDAPLCSKCPAKIYYCESKELEFGEGNFVADIMIVLPPKATIKTYYKDYIEKIFAGIKDLNLEYITFHPKCYCEINHKVYSKKCEQYLLYEIRKINSKIIIFFGADIPEILQNNSNIKTYYFNDIGTIFYNKNQINIYKEEILKIL